MIKCICFGVDQWATLARHHLRHILPPISTSPLFLLSWLSLSFALSIRSLLSSLFSSCVSFFSLWSILKPAHCMNHRSFSESRISSLNGQRAFSALLAKSTDLNQEVLKGTQHRFHSNSFELLIISVCRDFICTQRPRLPPIEFKLNEGSMCVIQT